MSDAEGLLDERETALWESIGGSAQDFAPANDTVEVPTEMLNRIFDRLEEHEQRIATLENGGAAVDEDAPVIEHYANIPEDERQDVLGTSDEIAVALHTSWTDIAWKLGDATSRRIGVDTRTKANAKHNPSRLKYRLKKELDRDFEAIQLYRGLQRLAHLSGGVEHSDKHGRVHITGGLYEYHHRPTIDASEMKHVLYRSTE